MSFDKYKRYKYSGYARFYLGESGIYDIRFIHDKYTCAKSSVKALLNIRWNIHKESGFDLGKIELNPQYLHLIEDVKEDDGQITLFDLYPEAMGVKKHAKNA